MRVIIYTRVSTAEQAATNQITQLKQYADKQEWSVVKVITDVSSGGKSAEERKGLNEVFQLAHKKQFDVLIFWSLDRFSREGSRKTLEYLTQLDNYNVNWHSFTEPYISSLGIFSDAIIAILSALAKQERIRISERTRAGLARVKAQGKKLGRPKNNHKKIAEAKRLRAEGLSFGKIAKELGVSRPRAYQLTKEEV